MFVKNYTFLDFTIFKNSFNMSEQAQFFISAHISLRGGMYSIVSIFTNEPSSSSFLINSLVNIPIPSPNFIYSVTSQYFEISKVGTKILLLFSKNLSIFLLVILFCVFATVGYLFKSRW